MCCCIAWCFCLFFLNLKMCTSLQGFADLWCQQMSKWVWFNFGTCSSVWEGRASCTAHLRHFYQQNRCGWDCHCLVKANHICCAWKWQNDASIVIPHSIQKRVECVSMIQMGQWKFILMFYQGLMCFIPPRPIAGQKRRKPRLWMPRSLQLLSSVILLTWLEAPVSANMGETWRNIVRLKTS